MTSLWLEEPAEPLGSSGSGRVDVAVVGGGVTGSCALELACGGMRVCVHDRVRRKRPERRPQSGHWS